LWGVDEASWHRYSGLDEMLQEGLRDRVSAKDMAAALKLIIENENRNEIRGVARWLFGEYKDGILKPEILALVIPIAARTGLASPRRANRKRTISVLHVIGTPEAVAALRECLADKIQARKLPPGQEVEPDGTVSFSPLGGDVKNGCSDRAHAALCLARLGDTQSLPAVRALQKKAKGEDRKVLDKALGLLKATGKEDEYPRITCSSGPDRF